MSPSVDRSMAALNRADISSWFSYKRRVHFYETDMMGITHHANYLRFLEEARVKWLREKGLSQYHGKEANCFFSVIEVSAKHHRPSYFEEEIDVRVQGKMEGARLIFGYSLWTERFQKPIVTALTTHVAVDTHMKLIKPPNALVKSMENEEWIEI